MVYILYNILLREMDEGKKKMLLDSFKQAMRNIK